MKRGKMALLALFLAFLGMFLISSQNIKAEANDTEIENTGISIIDGEDNYYEYLGAMYGNGDTITRSLSLKGPVGVSLTADNGSYCGYYSSCVTLRGDYYYTLNTTGTYNFTIIDYYTSSSSTKDVWVTYNITITVTEIIESSSSSSSGSNSSGSSSSTTSSTAPVWYTDNISKIYGGTSIYVSLTSTNEIWGYSSASTYYDYKWLSSSGTTLSSGSTFTSQTSTNIAFTTTAPFVLEDTECYLQIHYRGKDTSGNLSTFKGKGVSYSSTYNSSFEYTYTIIGDSEAPVWYTKDVDEIESGQDLHFQLRDSYSGIVGTFYYGWTTSSTYLSSYTYSSINGNAIKAPTVTSTTILYLWIKNTGKDNAGNLATYEGKEPYSIGTSYDTPIIYKYTIKPSGNDISPIWYTEDIDEIDSGDTLSFQLTTDLYSATLSGNTSVSSYYKYGWSTSSTTEPSSWENSFSSTTTKITFTITAPGVATSTPYYLWVYMRSKDSSGNLSNFSGKQPFSYGATYNSYVIYQYTINSKGPVWFVEDKDTISQGETIKVELIGENIADYSTSSFKYGWSYGLNTEPDYWYDDLFLRLPSIVSFYATCTFPDYYYDEEEDTEYEYDGVYLWIYRVGSDTNGNLSTFSGKEPSRVGDYWNWHSYYAFSELVYFYQYTGGTESNPVLFTENVDSVNSTENIRFLLSQGCSYDYCYEINTSPKKYGWSTSSTTMPSTWETEFIKIDSNYYGYTKIIFDVTVPYVESDTTYYLWIYNRGGDRNGQVSAFKGKQPISSSSSATSRVVYQYTILGTNDNEAPVWSAENKSEIMEYETILIQLIDNKSIWKSSYAKNYYKYGWSTSTTTTPSWQETFSNQSTKYIELNVIAPSVTTSTTYYLWIYYRGQDVAGNLATFTGKQPYSTGSAYNSNVIYQYTIIPDNEAPVWYTEDVDELKVGDEFYLQLTSSSGFSSSIKSSTSWYAWSTSSTSEPSSWSYFSFTSNKISISTTVPSLLTHNDYYLWIYYRGSDMAGNLAIFEGKQPYSSGTTGSSRVIYKYTIIPDNEAPVWYTEEVDEINSGETIYFQLTDNLYIWEYSHASTYYKYGWSTSPITDCSTWQTSFTSINARKVSFTTTAPIVAEKTIYYLVIYIQGEDASGNVPTFSGKEPYSSGSSYYSVLRYQYTILTDTTSPTIRLNSFSGEILEDKSTSYYNSSQTLFFEDNLYFKKYVVSGPVSHTGTGDRYTLTTAGSYSITAYDYAGNMTSISIEISNDGTISKNAVLDNPASLIEGKIYFTISGSNNVQEKYKNGQVSYFVGKYGNYNTTELIESGIDMYGVSYEVASSFFEKGEIITPQGLVGDMELYIKLSGNGLDTIYIKSGCINIGNEDIPTINLFTELEEFNEEKFNNIVLTSSNIISKDTSINSNYLLFISMILISSLLAIEVIIIRKYKKAHN